MPGVAYAKDKNKDASDSVALNASDVYSINQLTVINYIARAEQNVAQPEISFRCRRNKMLPLGFSEKAFDYLFLIISIVALQDEELFFFIKMDKTIFTMETVI